MGYECTNIKRLQVHLKLSNTGIYHLKRSISNSSNITLSLKRKIPLKMLQLLFKIQRKIYLKIQADHTCSLKIQNSRDQTVKKIIINKNFV